MSLIELKKMSESLYKNGEQSDDSDETKHDGFDIFGSFFGRVNIWLGILIFILFILVNTTFFIEDILKKISDNFVSNDGNPTSNGIIVQGIFLSVGYIVLDLLVSGGVL